MPFRMSRTLKFEVEIKCKKQNGFMFRDADVAPILLRMEDDGETMRCLNKNGQLIWRLTPECKAELEQEKNDCRREQRRRRPGWSSKPGVDWEI